MNLAKKSLEIKTLFLCSLGGAFEYYDFSLFALMTAVLSEHFFNDSIPEIAVMKTFGIFAAGYIARFLGGFIFSHIGDTSGRKQPFMLTLFLMAFPTLGIAFLPTYQQIGLAAPVILLLFRIAQGFALGGEAPCAMTLAHELPEKNKKSFAMGILFGGIIFGSFFASFLFTIINHYMTKENFNDWGWRIPFFVGGLLGILGAYLRKNLKESKDFLVCKNKNVLTALPFFTLVQKNLKLVILSVLLVLPSAISFFYFLIFSSGYLENQYHYKPDFVKITITVGFFLNAIFCVLFGFLSDKINVKKVYGYGVFSLAVLTLPVHFVFMAQINILLFFYIVLVCVALAACVGSVFSLVASLFATEIRTSALALVMNIANGLFVGLTPLLFTSVVHLTGWVLFPTIYIFVICSLALIVLKKYIFKKFFL